MDEAAFSEHMEECLFLSAQEHRIEQRPLSLPLRKRDARARPLPGEAFLTICVALNSPTARLRSARRTLELIWKLPHDSLTKEVGHL